MSKVFKRMRPLLGTYVEIGSTDNNLDLASDFSAAFSAIEMIQNLLSFHDSTSDLSRLNASYGDEVQMHPLSIKVLRLAKAVAKASSGLFNPSVGGELQRLGHLPDHRRHGCDCHPIVPIGSAEDIQIKGRRVKLSRPIQVVLDGIAKGFAVDCAIDLMQSRGWKNGWVNAGGDLRVFGDLDLPIQRRNKHGTLESLGVLRNAAIATSEVTANHLPGQPSWLVTAKNMKPCPAVSTVIATTAWRADALTKVGMLVPGPDKHRLVSQLGGMFIGADGDL